MADTFFRHKPLLSDPAENAFVVTPNNTNDLTFTTRAVYVGGTGNVSLVLKGDTTNTAILFANVQQGTYLPVRATRVVATGTTATDIIALY